MFKDRIVKSVDLIQNFIGTSPPPSILSIFIYRHWRETEIRRGSDV